MRAQVASVAIFVSVLAATCECLPPSPRSPSVLVVGESGDVQHTHSQFLSALKDCGRTIAFKDASDPSIQLRKDGSYLYGGVVILAPHASLQSKLPVSRVMDFVDAGGDLFVATDTGYSSYTDKLVEALGVDLDDRSHVMIDYQHQHESLHDSNRTFIRAGGWVRTVFSPPGPAVSAKLDDDSGTCGPNDVVFHGAGGTLFTDNELVQPLLWGSGSSFGREPGSVNELSKIPRVAGSGAILAAGVNTRVGSRATWFGSMRALSDEVLEKAGSAHAAAVKSMAQWALAESGVLRIARVAHGRAEDGSPGGSGGPADYRVKDVVEFVVQVQQWDGGKGEWVGFETDDMQVEFVMMNPWVRARLRTEAGSGGVYKARIQVPDQIGVYKFKVEYVRPGYSSLFLEKVVAVRPFLHNEYERFIPMASPYYVASLSMMVGVIILGVVLLFGGDDIAWLSNGDDASSKKSE